MQTGSPIYIVTGYHSNTPISESARSERLMFRFALVLGTFHPDIDYMYFQDSIFLESLTQISKKIDHDTLIIKIDDKEYYSIESLVNHLIAIPEEDRHPPDEVHFRKNGKLVCLEQTEFWALCGGEAPYSDSYTASFYTEKDMSEHFESACRTAIEAGGSQIKEIIHASPEPIEQAWWNKFIRWIGH